MDTNNFAVEVTAENKEVIQNWFEKTFPGDERSFQPTCHFGRKDGKALGRGPGYAPEVPIISFFEFSQYINNSYEIY